LIFSGKVNEAVGGESCNVKDEGPTNMKIELLSHTHDLVSITFTSAAAATCSQILFQVQKIQSLTTNMGVVYSGLTPFGVSLLVAGFDDNGPQLTMV
ncbi:hypothetical protein MKX01_020811, partial [Papaver californicum]